ncbi:hypothetical protein JCM3765_007140 [Sporobolomyces pararoseus]
MPSSLSPKETISPDETPHILTTAHSFRLAKSFPSSTQNALLLPSPRMIRSSSKENAPTTSTMIRKKKALPSTSSTVSKSRPSLGRRVVFSPTPLPSLQASPKHKRTFSEHLETYTTTGGGTEGGRPAKRIRRLGVYSNHPFLGLATSSDDSRDGSSSPEEEEYKSSPPTTPEEDGEPSIPSATTIKGAGGSYFKFPFTFPGLTPPKSKPTRSPFASRQVRNTQDDDEETDTATDSESESNFVSSLLLHRLPSSSSSISSSSSPIKSPCRSLQQLPRRSSSASTSWLKGILKPVVGGTPVLKASNEKEGTKKNGRGRKHIIGWEDMRLTESEDASTTGEKRGGDGKKVPESKEAGLGEGSGRTRTTRASSSKATNKKAVGEEGEDDEDERRRQKGTSGGRASSTAGGAGGSETQPNEGASRPVPRDDAWLLRTPLLTLKASLRPVSANHVRPPTTSASTVDFAPPLEPRSSPLAAEDAAMLVDGGDDDEGDEFNNLFETPTFLTDVESAYVDLTRALFQLPTDLPSPSTTLEPLKSFRKTFIRCLARDVENIMSFPVWVKSTQSPSSPISSPSSSSAPSSPIQASAANSPNAAGGKGKKSLTGEQMRRLRDEIGVAQAGIRCASAVMRDERIYSIFTSRELTSLLRLISTLPTSTNLNNLVQRDLFPFVPFLLHDQTLPPQILAPLVTSHLLPAFQSLLTLPHRADRHRISFGESLSAISLLLSTHSREMIREGNWKVWFRSSMLGLWDGPKKGVSVKARSLKVAGRLVRCLTAPIEWTADGKEWVIERESIGRHIGEAMLALLYEVPEDLIQGKKVEYSRLQILTQQWSQMTKSKPGTNNNVDEVNLLFHVSLLSILPALLGPSFRKLEEKGIGPWIKPYNQLYQSQTSVHILATLALSWTNLSYAFFRSTSVADDVEVSWILRRRGNENKALAVLSNIFKTRQDVWARGEGSSTPTKKERQRTHAKALSIAYGATLHGLAVSILHGPSSVREQELSTLSKDQQEHFDEVFDRVVVPTLPNLTRSDFVETSRIGWNLLAALLRPRTPSDRFAVLEDIVNPALLDVQFASAKTSEFLDFALATSFAKAFDSSKTIGWGEEWVQSRLGKVLKLFETCIASSRAALVEASHVFSHSCSTKLSLTSELTRPQGFASSTWSSILDSVESDEKALSETLDWLIKVDSSSFSLAQGIARDLWTITISRIRGPVATAVATLLEQLAGESQTSRTIFAAWQRSSEKPDFVPVALARMWAESLLDTALEVSIDRVESIMTLLRHYISAESLSTHSESFERLAASLNARLWQGETPDAEEIIRSTLKLPTAAEAVLQLCTLFLSTSRELSGSVQSALTSLGGEAVRSVLDSDTVREEIIPLIADMLSAASNDTYPVLYETVLESLAKKELSSDGLVKFIPLLAPSLDRAIDLHAEKVADDDSSLETFAPRPHCLASLHPLIAFNKFWRKTYAQASLGVIFPPDLVTRIKLVSDLAQDVVDTQPQDSELRSKMEETVRTFSGVYERARAQASTNPTLAVSTRDYEADLDQSRFHQATGDVATDDYDDSTPVAASAVRAPSVSLHGTVDNRAGSVIQETPREILISNSRPSYASLASSEGDKTGDLTEVEEPLIFEETLGDVKRRAKKRKRASEPPRPATFSPASSEDDDVIIVRSSQSSSSSAKPPRKKNKSASKRKNPKVSSEEADPSPAPVVVPEGQKPTPSTRAKRSKGKGRAMSEHSPSLDSTAESSSPSPSSQVAVSNEKTNRTARRRTQDEEAIRRVLSLPLETVANIGKLIGGTASLHRLMAIGEAAKDCFEKLKRSPSH